MTFVARTAGRADAVVAAELGDTSRRRLGELFAAGHVRIDGRVAKKGDRVALGATVELTRLPETDLERRPLPEASDARVLWLDDDLVAIDKPALWPTHPRRGGELGTAANWLVAAHPETQGIGDDPREAGFVHRLDLGTTGILLAARSRAAWLDVRQQFRAHRVGKTYIALVAGPASAGESSVALATRGGKSAADPTRGLAARTEWRVLESLATATLIEATTRTGRMHQIRAHLALAGHPLLGDPLYGGPAAAGVDGHFLHAATLVLEHPNGSGRVEITAPLGATRQSFLAAMR